MDLLRRYINKKSILLLGFGIEGKSTYRLLSRLGGYKSLAIADISHIEYEFDTPVDIITGEDYQKRLNDYDIVFKSPGVVPQEDISRLKCEITSQTEVFMKAYRNNIIGITGTKGKSTTASLLAHILKNAGRPCVLMGNIGVPAFDILPLIDSNTIIVNELSSHQLEYISVSPHIGVLLNIYEEHLDHYGTFEKYVKAKKNIYLHQTNDDILICNSDVVPGAGECRAVVYIASDFLSRAGNDSDIKAEGEYICFGSHRLKIPARSIKLSGRHNYYNIAIAYAISKLLHVSDSDVLNGLKSYQPLPHRMEFIGEWDEVKYYDDSISTVCQTTIQAIDSLPNVDTVLIGGMDRGIDYGPLIEFLSESSVANIILMYDTGSRIYSDIEKSYPELLERTKLVDTLEEAVSLAKKLTVKGGTCLLSPAAASYGLFKNFEERGDAFKKYLMKN